MKRANARRQVSQLTAAIIAKRLQSRTSPRSNVTAATAAASDSHTDYLKGLRFLSEAFIDSTPCSKNIDETARTNVRIGRSRVRC